MRSLIMATFVLVSVPLSSNSPVQMNGSKAIPDPSVEQSNSMLWEASDPPTNKGSSFSPGVDAASMVGRTFKSQSSIGIPKPEAETAPGHEVPDGTLLSLGIAIILSGCNTAFILFLVGKQRKDEISPCMARPSSHFSAIDSPRENARILRECVLPKPLLEPVAEIDFVLADFSTDSASRRQRSREDLDFTLQISSSQDKIATLQKRPIE
ncbi:MAG TPA: hypothetical protein VGB89_12550 [Bacteroidota bacterium]